MRNYYVALSSIFVAGAANAQVTTTTNCHSYIPNNVQCTSTTPQTNTVDWGAFNRQMQQQQQQTQQNINQGMANLGAAIAANRERKRQRDGEKAIEVAQANDKDVPQPPPADEAPVRLVCNVQGNSAIVALYEKHSRVDTNLNGSLHSRPAIFTVDTISWVTPIARTSINRLDGTITFTGSIKAVEGQSATGSCVVASERKF